MPMIDIYAAAGTFRDPHALASSAATTLMRIEEVPEIPMFRENTAAFVHELAAGAISDVDGGSDHIRVQVLTNAGALDRAKQLAVVEQLTTLVVDAAGDRRWRAELGPPDRGGARRMGPLGSRSHERGAGDGGPRGDRVPSGSASLLARRSPPGRPIQPQTDTTNSGREGRFLSSRL